VKGSERASLKGFSPDIDVTLAYHTSLSRATYSNMPLFFSISSYCLGHPSPQSPCSLTPSTNTDKSFFILTHLYAKGWRPADSQTQ